MKRELHCKRYGRYVDDFYVVSANCSWLCSLQEPIENFLYKKLGLEINRGKTVIRDVRQGVEFLGAYLKPRRKYISNSTRKRIESKVAVIPLDISHTKFRSMVNSFLGILSHYRSYKIRKHLLSKLSVSYNFGYYQKGVTKYILYPSFSITRMPLCPRN